jgi:hypothetical protein
MIARIIRDKLKTRRMRAVSIRQNGGLVKGDIAPPESRTDSSLFPVGDYEENRLAQRRRDAENTAAMRENDPAVAGAQR